MLSESDVVREVIVDSEFSIVPEPKSIRLSDGTFDVTAALRMLVSRDAGNASRRLQESLALLCGAKPRVLEADGEICFIELGSGEQLRRIRPEDISNLGSEGYLLRVRPDGLLIAGNRPAGVFYGVQTLLQILADGSLVRCMDVYDWPSMAIRGIHMDMKAGMPSHGYLISAIKKLATYKINTVLLEYEDKFPYETHPCVSSPIAYTKDELRELIQVAKENHIQIMPLVQSLGHMEYVLKHPEYAHLREEDGELSQLCPSNRESLVLFKDLFHEVAEMHTDSGYFHVGADEAFLLGRCPMCAQRVEKIGKTGLFADYLKDVCEFVIEAGKIPVVWDDMLTRLGDPRSMRALPKETVVMYWEYQYQIARESENVRPIVYWEDNTVLCSREWARKSYNGVSNPIWFDSHGWVEELPGQVLREYRKYWGDRFPRQLGTFAYIDLIEDLGFPIIGASAIKCGSDDFYLPAYNLRIPNVIHWAREAEANGCLGVISSAWAELGKSPFELLWYGIAASGEFYWSGSAISEREFDEKYNWREFGHRGLDVTDALFNISTGQSLFIEKALDDLCRMNSDSLFVEYAKLSARIGLHHKKRESLFGELDSAYHKLGQMLPSARDRLLQRLSALEGNRRALMTDVTAVFSKTMPRAEIEEYIRVVFSLEIKRTDEYVDLLAIGSR